MCGRRGRPCRPGCVVWSEHGEGGEGMKMHGKRRAFVDASYVDGEDVAFRVVRRGGGLFRVGLRCVCNYED